MAIEIVDLPIENGGSFQFAMLNYQRVRWILAILDDFGFGWGRFGCFGLCLSWPIWILLKDSFNLQSHKTKHLVQHLRRLLGHRCHSALLVHEGNLDINDNCRLWVKPEWGLGGCVWSKNTSPSLWLISWRFPMKIVDLPMKYG